MSSTLIVYFLIGVLPPPIVMSLLSNGLATFDSNLSLSAFSLISPFTFALLAVFAFSPFRFFIFPVSLFRPFLNFSCLFFSLLSAASLCVCQNQLPCGSVASWSISRRMKL